MHPRTDSNRSDRGALHATRHFRGTLHEVYLFLLLSLSLDALFCSVAFCFVLFSFFRSGQSTIVPPCIRPSSGQPFFSSRFASFLSHAHAALEGKKPTTASNNRTLFGRLIPDLTSRHVTYHKSRKKQRGCKSCQGWPHGKTFSMALAFLTWQ